MLGSGSKDIHLGGKDRSNLTMFMARARLSQEKNLSWSPNVIVPIFHLLALC